jgi:hypothetical protein
MQDGLVAGGSDSSETLAQRASSHKKAVKRYGGMPITFQTNLLQMALFSRT